MDIAGPVLDGLEEHQVQQLGRRAVVDLLGARGFHRLTFLHKGSKITRFERVRDAERLLVYIPILFARRDRGADLFGK